MLSELGFAEILEATAGDRAVSLAADHCPEVAIIDMAASGQGWLPTVSSITEKHRIPVILLGSAVSAESVEQGIAAGAGGFLTKPLRKEELWPAIEIAAMHNHELEELKEKVAKLEGALESRKVVDRAKAVLMRGSAMSEPDAFRRMQKLAMDKRTTLVRIAEAILLTEGGAAAPDAKR
jgi:response regulator NasT